MILVRLTNKIFNSQIKNLDSIFAYIKNRLISCSDNKKIL